MKTLSLSLALSLFLSQTRTNAFMILILWQTKLYNLFEHLLEFIIWTSG